MNLISEQNQANILIVDDNKMVRKAVRLMLEEDGFHVCEGVDGQDALNLIGSNPSFDLIITDISMPTMDGIALCHHIKNSTELSAIPVIILSMFESEHEIEQGFQAGADAYVTKRQFQNSLLKVVHDTLERSEVRRKCMVLVVDDSRVVRLSIESYLTEQGFHVITAENGREALDTMYRSIPNVVLSDYEMPAMDGLSLCRAIKNNERFRHIPFIAMSIFDEHGTMKRFIQNGAAAYITKPFNFHELSILIEKIISDHFMLLFKERKRLEAESTAMLGSIASLADALEARDPYTRGHSEAVARMVGGMLRHAQASEEDIARAIFGAKLHDIGKIGVRDNVLFKESQLTDEEWQHIKQHPEIGANILKPITSLFDILPIVRHHHERFDGNGYPDGLAGEAIPYWARLTAVADTVSAVTENRPYRLAHTMGDAILTIKEVSGTQLCPSCVDLFLDWHHSALDQE